MSLCFGCRMLAISARSGKISLEMSGRDAALRRPSRVVMPKTGCLEKFSSLALRTAQRAVPTHGEAAIKLLPVSFLLDACLSGSTNLPHANPCRAQWTENGAFLTRG